MVLFLFLAGVLMLVMIAPYDLKWIHYFKAHQVDWFINLMSESLFELEKPGAGDIVVLFYIISLSLYCLSSLIDSASFRGAAAARIRTWLARRPGFVDFLQRYRLQLEFLVVSSFCSSTLMVKTLKWSMARPRPKKILRGTREFNQWYEVGPYFLDEGRYRASFPSGHTASAITLIGLAYILIYCCSDRRWRTGGRILMGAVICFTMAMATARVMTTAHWPTDVVFSVFGGWLIIHLLFFYFYNFTPACDRYSPGKTGWYTAPPFRGISICWYLSWICLSLVAIVLGMKHYFNDRWPWLILACLPAIALLIYSSKRLVEQRA